MLQLLMPANDVLPALMPQYSAALWRTSQHHGELHISLPAPSRCSD